MLNISSTILINKQREVLLMLRDNKPGITDPGVWGFIGGHAKDGESPKVTASREINEETGLIVDKKLLQIFVTIQTRERKWDVFLAFGDWDSTDLQRGEGQELRFVPLDHAFRLPLGQKQRYVLSMLPEHLQRYVREEKPGHSFFIPNKTA